MARSILPDFVEVEIDHEVNPYFKGEYEEELQRTYEKEWDNLARDRYRELSKEHPDMSDDEISVMVEEQAQFEWEEGIRDEIKSQFEKEHENEVNGVLKEYITYLQFSSCCEPFPFEYLLEGDREYILDCDHFDIGPDERGIRFPIREWGFKTMMNVLL
jgi:hypothetical protein